MEWCGFATLHRTRRGTVAAAVTEIGPSGTRAPLGPAVVIVQENTTGWDLSQTVVRNID